MTKEEVIQFIKQNGDPTSKIAGAEAGAFIGDLHFGTSTAKLKELAKEIGKDHALAYELWHSGILEGKIIATMIEEPQKVTEEQLDSQVTEIHTCKLADKFCENMAFKTPYVNAKIEEWTSNDREMIKRMGYILLGLKAKTADDYTDEDFEKHLAAIQKEINGERNWVKEAMNYALIEIGSKDRHLNRLALTVAREIGEVAIGYDDSSRKTPDARKILSSDKIIAQISISTEL